MLISGLAEATGVPIPTLKYYLREGLLMPGRATSATRASYGPEHLERVRLIRALVDGSGISIASAKNVIAALENPPTDPMNYLEVAQLAVPPPATPADRVSDEARELMAELGWNVCEGDETLLGALTTAVDNARSGGLPLTAERLRAYAHGAEMVAEVDIEATFSAADLTEMMSTVTLGTVLIEPLVLTLRRLAHQAILARRLGYDDMEPASAEPVEPA